MADDKVTIWNGGLKFGRPPAANELLVGNGEGFDQTPSGVTFNPDGSIAVAGIVESTTGGFKFPDDTVQTSAAVSGPSLPLSVANGGTGTSALTLNNVILGNGTTAVKFVAPSTSGNVLTSNGTTWSSTIIPAPTALSTATGAAPSYSARAWVNFNGLGTVAINSSGNVSSITDNGAGDYTLNFTVSMPDANYAVVSGQVSYTPTNNTVFVSLRGTGSTSLPTLKTTSQVRVLSGANIGYDLSDISVTIFR